jgi:hypothetical protein
MANHPYYLPAYQSVINTVHQKLEEKNLGLTMKNIMSRAPYDININMDSPLLQWTADMNVREDFIYKYRTVEWVKLFLKVGNTKMKKELDGTSTYYADHVFLTCVEIRRGEIKKIEVVDTAPLIVDTLRFTKRIGYFLDIPIDRDLLEIPLNNLLVSNKISFYHESAQLQRNEKELCEKGYCNAWVLYFIDMKISGNSFYKIYKKLLSGDPTRTIINWWETKI